VTQDANDILMGGGSPALKFETVGTSYTGTVAAEPTSSQQTDFRTKVPETWKDGSPKMQVLVQLSTTLRDPEKPEDDGTRTLYIKGKELTNAIRAAVRAAGANGIHTGGILTVAYIGDGQAETGLNPPKLYQANYQPPATSFAGVTGPATQAAAAAAAAAPAQATQQPDMAAVAAAMAAAAAQQPAIPCPPGVDPAMWTRLTPAQQQAVINAQPQPAF
jgi:hypothetical protein